MAAGVFIVYSDEMLDKLIIDKVSEQFGLQQVSLPKFSTADLLNLTQYPEVAQKLLAFLRNPVKKSKMLKILQSSGLLDGKTTAQTVEMAESLYPELFQVCEAKIEFALLHANQLNAMQRGAGYKEHPFSTPEKNGANMSHHQSPYRVPGVAQVRLPIQQFEQLAREATPTNRSKGLGLTQVSGSLEFSTGSTQRQPAEGGLTNDSTVMVANGKHQTLPKDHHRLEEPGTNELVGIQNGTNGSHQHNHQESGSIGHVATSISLDKHPEDSLNGATNTISSGDVYAYINPNEVEQLAVAREIFHLATPDIPIEAVLHNLFIQMLFGLPVSDPEPSLQKLNRLFHKNEVAKTKKSLEILRAHCTKTESDQELTEFLDLMDTYAQYRLKVEQLSEKSRQIIKDQQKQWTEKCIYYPVYFTEQIHETFSRPYQRVVKFDHPPLERWKASQSSLQIEDYFKIEQLVAKS